MVIHCVSQYRVLYIFSDTIHFGSVVVFAAAALLLFFWMTAKALNIICHVKDEGMSVAGIDD
jgi:hypothetical protein